MDIKEQNRRLIGRANLILGNFGLKVSDKEKGRMADELDIIGENDLANQLRLTITQKVAKV